MVTRDELKTEAIDYLKQKIGGCFGAADGIFAGHPLDEDRAKELRKFALQKGISLNKAVDVALTYMLGKQFIQEHIDEQLPEIRSFFAKKLT